MAEQESPTATAPATFSTGPWVASRGQCDGEAQDWWDIKVERGVPRYSYMQDLAMVFNSDDQAEANATLMAAAPDLLVAAQQAVEMWKWDTSSGGNAALERLCEAIEKATWNAALERLCEAIEKATS